MAQLFIKIDDSMLIVNDRELSGRSRINSEMQCNIVEESEFAPLPRAVNPGVNKPDMEKGTVSANLCR